jgi:hypothetical protein
VIAQYTNTRQRGQIWVAGQLHVNSSWIGTVVQPYTNVSSKLAHYRFVPWIDPLPRREVDSEAVLPIAPERPPCANARYRVAAPLTDASPASVSGAPPA